MNTERLAAAATAARTRIPAQGIAAAVVAGDAVVWQCCEGMADATNHHPVTSNTLFSVASITKTMAAFTVLAAKEAGVLALDDDVNTRLREIRVGRDDRSWPRPRIVDLLTHTAGLSDLSNWMSILRPWRSNKSGVQPLSVREVTGPVVKPHAPPGQKWSYSNTGFQLLGQAVEDATGCGFSDLLAEHVFSRAEMKTATYRTPSSAEVALGYERKDGGLVPAAPVGEMWADGGVWASLDDMTAYARHLLRPSKNGLPPAWCTEAFAPHYQLAGRFDRQGLSWARRPFAGHETVAHGGNTDGFSAYLVLAPDDGVGCVVLLNTATYLGSAALAFELLAAALDLDSPSADLPAPPLSLRLDDFVGAYHPAPGLFTNEMAWGAFGGRARVERAGDGLSLRGRFGLLRKPLPLHPLAEAPDRFRLLYDDAALDIDFFRAADGRVEGLLVNSVNLVLFRK